jgi:peptide/nickel transport system permease protein
VWRFIARRLLGSVVVAFLLSIVTFLIFVKLPSVDPARLAAGRQTNPETLRAIRIKLGLDGSTWSQYWTFARGLIPWPGFFLDKDTYFSYQNFVPVRSAIAHRLPVTAVETAGAVVLWLAFSLPAGVVSALRPRSKIDRATMSFAIFGVSAPIFWVAYLLLFVFWFKLRILPGSGLPPYESLTVAVLRGRFVLPWITIALSLSAFYVRMMRTQMMGVMQEDYIRTARAKGLPERKVVWKHGVRGAITPIVSMLGVDVGVLLGGAIITETVFNLPGLGQYAVQSAFNGDIPSIMGVTIVGALFILAANLIVDVAYAYLDPRILH